MPTYRIYYAEREVNHPAARDPSMVTAAARLYRANAEYVSETEWEEEVEAKSESGALEAFFRDHLSDRREVHIVEEDGEAHPVEGVGGYDPDRTYIWVEQGKLMEYQGLDERTPGKVTCPLCDGTGEVDEEVADEFLEEYGEEEGGGEITVG
ncbi:MAG: hypothetical protein Q7T33_05710 [Dehalococcoidia bacterium]|nr:hypothetical protein [Dehalococcoidia bacterium]